MAQINPVQAIHNFVSNLAAREIFCSKDLLRFAKRSQLDNITSDLVASNVIVRLARGVFCRRDKKDTKLPSMQEIIEAKARAWKRRLGRASSKLLAGFHPKKKEARKRTFLTTSATSSMQTIYGRVYYKRLSVNRFESDTTNSDKKLKSLLQILIHESTDFFTRTALRAVTSLSHNLDRPLQYKPSSS